jgi:hypothetical protein
MDLKKGPTAASQETAQDRWQWANRQTDWALPLQGSAVHPQGQRAKVTGLQPDRAAHPSRKGQTRQHPTK